MRTIDRIICKLDSSRGAQMGRANIGRLLPGGLIQKDECPHCGWLAVTFSQDDKTISCPQCETDYDAPAPVQEKIYDCLVPMSDSAYDSGGAYWGIGEPLRVLYTKSLSLVQFYRGVKRLPVSYGYKEELFSGTSEPRSILRIDKESVRLLYARDHTLNFERLWPYGWRKSLYGMHEGVTEPTRPCSCLWYGGLGLKYYRFVDDAAPSHTFTVLALPERVEALLEEEGELKTWSHQRPVRREMFPIDYTNAAAELEERLAASMESRVGYDRFNA